MVCKVERYGSSDHDIPAGKTPGALKAMVFSCDADGCNIVADDEEIEKQGGLRHMGWWAAGGKHYCPTHFDQGGEAQW